MSGQKTLQILKTNKSIILLAITVVASLGLLYYILFVNQDIVPFIKKTSPPAKQFSSLDEPLNNVVNTEQSSQAIEVAQKENLALTNDKVTVVITLKDDSFLFTPEYGREQIRYGKYIQALVKVGKLEELANNPKIENITAPQKATQKPPSNAPIIISPNSISPKPTSPQSTPSQ